VKAPRSVVAVAVTGGNRRVRRAAGWIAHPRRQARAYDRKDPEQRQERRDESRRRRWRVRSRYRRVTKNKRVAACGLPGVRPDGAVVLRLTDAQGTPAQHRMGADGRVAGFSGLFACANVWVCPECGAKIAAKRAAELEEVLAHYVAQGGTAVLVTFTMRHWAEHPLAELLAARALAWSAVNEGGTWVKHKRLTGFAGYCQVLEVTESLEHGWHPHVHAVLVFHGRPSRDALDTMIEGMWSRWCAALVRAGMPAPVREHGLDVQYLDHGAAGDRSFESVKSWAAYVTKGIAGEATLGPAKEAKGSNRSIMELMVDALIPQVWENAQTREIVETIDVQARAKLAEYEAAVKGRKQMNWSQGDYDLRKGAQLGEEQSDEQVVEEELDGQDVAVIPRESWPAVEPRAPELLNVAERHGVIGARRWLDALGVEWWRPTRLTEHHGRRHDRSAD
jgi:hypothetical protein